jgi:hypothetical protein
MCSYVRFVQLFRFFHFCARGCTEVHASANRCKSAGVLCSCGRFGSRGRNGGGRDLRGEAELLFETGGGAAAIGLVLIVVFHEKHTWFCDGSE